MFTIKLTIVTLLALIACGLTAEIVKNDHYDYECPTGCVCTNITVTKPGNANPVPGIRANCDRARFIRIPSVLEFPNNTFEIDLSANNFTKIHVLDAMDELTFLDLSVNGIDDISPYAFKGFKSLLTLDLSHNLIEELEVETFDGLNNLKVLNLSNNHLRALDDNIFESLTSLVELQLSNNPLVHISTQVMKPLQSLSILALNQIGAYSLSSDNFHFNHKLTELQLSANKFVKVPNEGLRSAAALKKLIFDGNQIHAINRESFAGLNSLEELSVSHSASLTDISRESFTDLYNLRLLSITSNSALSYIDPMAFYRSYNFSWFKLEEIYLNDNRLTELDDTALFWCRLKVLDLRSNHWNCDCTLRWIKKCPNPDLLVSGVRCQSPANLRGIDVAMIDASAFTCQLNTDREMKVFRLMVIVLGSIMLLLLTSLLAVLIKRDDIAKWWRERGRRQGSIYYVKARTAPNDSVEF